MDQVRTCKQCGEIKPLDAYRKYYGNRKGSYRVCKTCEAINGRYKYLLAKGDTSPERAAIEELYELLRAAGLQPPNFGTGKSMQSTTVVADMIAKRKEQMAKAARIGATPDVPEELQSWLIKSLAGFDPEYLQDTIYETLVHTYAPVIRIDSDTLLPVHDEKYRHILIKILERFDAYEDAYYETKK